MRTLTGQEVRQAVRGRWLSRNEPVPIFGVSIDSRTAKPNDLFVAIEGPKHDAHDYLKVAADAGCVSAVVNLKKAPTMKLMERFPAGVIGVPDTRAALMDLAGFYRSIIPATVVGITGSNGKTTVKNMVHHILQKRLVGSASPKSFNNEIGVPLTLLNAGAGDDYVICEVGSNAPGEIARLARLVKPNIAVVTSVSEAHLEKLQSIERVAVEKAALLGWLGERDIAVVTADSEPLDHALKSYEKRTIRFGASASAQLRLTKYEPTPTGQRFQINDRDWVELSVPGRHNALNALAAMAVVARFGFTQEDAAEALADFQGVEMRLEFQAIDDVTLINDAYNANPGSMLAAVDVLGDIKGKRRVLIVGDMLELGPRGEEIHAEIGRAVAVRRVNAVISIGPLARRLAEGADRIGVETHSFHSVDDATGKVAGLLQSGDVILLKGSRGMQLERLIPEIRHAFGEEKKSSTSTSKPAKTNTENKTP